MKILIIGQGLAGSLLAYFLEEGGADIWVADPGGYNSSKVAAGIFNPLTGRRMTRTWMAETLFPFAEQTYRHLEGLLGASFYFPLPMYRIFPNAAELEANRRKVTEADIDEFGLEFTESLQLSGLQTDSSWGCKVSRTGWLDTRVFLETFRHRLAEKHRLIPEKLEYKDIIPGPDGATWHGQSFDKIIFCEGFLAKGNPWFGGLPFSPVKGEVLTLRIPDLPEDHILMRGKFLIPIGNGIYRAGATYSWDPLDDVTTDAAREEILEGLRKMLSVQVEVIDHQAGVRPAMQGRRPLMGLHWKFPALGVFNGLGTKGVTLAPWFADKLANHILTGAPLPEEVDINRVVC